MLRHGFHMCPLVAGAATQAVQAGMEQGSCWLVSCLHPAAGRHEATTTPSLKASDRSAAASVVTLFGPLLRSSSMLSGHSAVQTTLQLRRASTRISTDEPGAEASSSGVADTQGKPVDPDWDWAFVVGAKAGRKPAIKRMQRHQWYFCNPNYDPNKPLPSRILPPHAPPSAAHVDEWQLFHATVGNKLHAKSRQEFVRFLRLRDVDWRDAFQKGLAEYIAEFKREQRLDAEKRRQSAWREYREQVFNNPLRPEWLKPQKAQ